MSSDSRWSEIREQLEQDLGNYRMMLDECDVGIRLLQDMCHEQHLITEELLEEQCAILAGRKDSLDEIMRMTQAIIDLGEAM